MSSSRFVLQTDSWDALRGHARPAVILAVYFNRPILESLPTMDEENELIALRRQKLEALQARGVRPGG